ncbi:MAG: PIG-L deacetylase family protein [Hyphomicrobiaceae bacterium]|nr:PIG-L deacetylase family protein [Hyphomicrobiaceae bacterium]
MKTLPLVARGEPISVLCLGAHADDIEIGAGGTILTWLAAGARVDVTWCVLSALGPRETEARAAAASFLAGARAMRIETLGFRDGYFPSEREAIKAWFEALKASVTPDVILTHHGDDAHQDHRIVAELTTNTFRDHLVLAYEIPKWDGDLGRPNGYQPLAAAMLERKIALLEEHFTTQRAKDWFDGDTFRGLARLRGMECRASERYAEAFHVRKFVLA